MDKEKVVDHANMKQEWIDYANSISETDRALGEVVSESVQCYDNGEYLAALSCLFVIIEESLRAALDSYNTTEGLFGLAKNAMARNLISARDFEALDAIRGFRNGLLHGNMHSVAMVKDGLVYPLNESGNRKELFETFASPALEIVSKLLALG